MITITAPLKIWQSEEGNSHFMSVREQDSGPIKLHAMETPRGFGSVKVECRIGATSWRTSLFPSKSSGGYFLPVKIAVVRETGISAGDEVTVELHLL